MTEDRERALCELCGEPMPQGEEMFNYHGYSGPCPKPPLPKKVNEEIRDWCRHQLAEQLVALDAITFDDLAELVEAARCEERKRWQELKAAAEEAYTYLAEFDLMPDEKQGVSARNRLKKVLASPEKAVSHD